MSLNIETLKKYLNINPLDSTNDEYLTLLLDNAKSFVEDYIQYPLSEIIYEDIKKGNDKCNLVLSYDRIKQLNNVFEDIEGDNIDITSEVRTYNLKVGEVERKEKAFYSDKFYKFVYVVGFNVLPKDLEYAIYLVALSMNAQSENTRMGIERANTPDGTFTYSFELLTPAVEMILHKYKSKVV